MSGTARLVHDREKAEQLWRPLYKAWFPKGIDDPDLALLCVHVDRAEYWDSPSSIAVKLAGFARAIVTGGTPRLGENREIRFDR